MATLIVLAAAGCTPDREPALTPPASSSPGVSPGAADVSPSSAVPSSSATSAAPSPSTPVESTVAPRPERSQTPVPLEEPATTGTGLTATLVAVKAVEAEAQLPGEISGPALAITVEVANSGSRAADLSAVVVTVLDADEAPGTEMTAPPAKPLPGRVRAQSEVRGIYVFRVPEDRRRPVTVTVSIGEAPVLVFTGNAT